MEIERIYLHTILQKCTCVKKAKREREGEGAGSETISMYCSNVLRSARLNTQLWLEVIVVLTKQEHRKKKKKRQKKELNTTMSHLSQSNQ